jgi:L-threonylcarbamoyladenylate synthase
MTAAILPADQPEALQKAVALLRDGHLVAFPTDTVYGVGALAFDQRGIDQLYAVKGRDSLKAIPILIGEPTDLALVTSGLGETARQLAQRFWPGPLTLVVPSHPGLPPNLSPQPTVGVRMPDHPVALSLLRSTGPMAVTSANLSGAESSVTAQQVFAQLGERIPVILDGGRTPGGLSSTVVDCTGPDLIILRQGPISLSELQAALS